MNNAGSAAPVFNAGGGGFQYEDEVAAFVLAAMLVGQPPFGADIGLVQRINWQTSASGWRFDDLLLVRCTVSCDTRLGLDGTAHGTMKRPRPTTRSSAKRARSASGARVAVRIVGHHFA